MDDRPSRRLRPTNSLPQTTGDFYAQKHGIPDQVHSAIPNVAMRIRQSVGQGSRTFDRTQSQPVNPNPSPFSTFLSDAESRADAEWSIRKEQIPARELKPFSSNEAVDALSLSPRGPGRQNLSTDERSHLEGKKLQFGPDGEVLLLEENKGRSSRQNGLAGLGQMQPGKKRLANDNEEEGQQDEEDTKTEMDEDEVLEMPELDPSGSGSSEGTTTNSTGDDFPSVFTSPQITHPELFGKQGNMPHRNTGRMGPPALPLAVGAGRQVRGLPGRMLGKTVSAPVRMGGGGGMDIDGEPAGQDGFDITEWMEESF